MQGVSGGDNPGASANFTCMMIRAVGIPTNISTAFGDGYGFAVYFTTMQMQVLLHYLCV